MLDWKLVARQRVLQAAGARLVGSLAVANGSLRLTTGPATWDDLVQSISFGPALPAACRAALQNPAVPTTEIERARGEIRSWGASASPRSLASFEERVRSDFRRGLTLSVGGWVLALTECCLYAEANDLHVAKRRGDPKPPAPLTRTTPSAGTDLINIEEPK